MIKLQSMLKKEREEKKLTQKEIAKILNIKQQTYNNYETGKRTPDIEMLIKIADYYKVSLDYLTGRYKLHDNIDRQKNSNDNKKAI